MKGSWITGPQKYPQSETVQTFDKKIPVTQLDDMTVMITASLVDHSCRIQNKVLRSGADSMKPFLTKVKTENCFLML